MRARVQPQPPGSRGGGNRARVHSGMSLEDLKRETAARLAIEGGDGDNESAEQNKNGGQQERSSGGVVSVDQQQQNQTTSKSNMYNNPQIQIHHYPREPVPSHYGASPHAMSPQNAMQYPPQRGPPRDYGPSPYNSYDVPSSYSSESSTRNYTDSQLGLGGGNNVVHAQHAQHQFYSPQPPAGYNRPPTTSQQQQQQQQYSTPRMPRHATVLKDRGSAENSVGSGSGGSDSMAGYAYNNRGNVKTSPKGGGQQQHGVGSYGKNLNKAATATAGGSSSGRASAAKVQPKEMRSPDGRHTPVRDRHLEGQVLFATPNHRRDVPSTPTVPYTEPPRSRAQGNNRPTNNPNVSPNYNSVRSPDHHSGGYSKGGSGGGGGGGAYFKNQPSKQQQHQSKLPHGLTVQELKEMTRARLAQESESGVPETGGGASDQSVQSTGTHNTSKGSDQVRIAHSNESVTRNLVQSNESLRLLRNQQQQAQALASQQPLQQPYQGQPPQLQPAMQQQHQYGNYPRHPSPVFGAGGPNQFNGNQQHVSRQPSPSFGLSSSQTKSQGETWETASTTSSEYPVTAAEAAFLGGNNAAMPFASPVRESNAMAFNRGRCYSAGATTTAGMPPSFEQHQAAYYDNVPLAGTGNRQRCATVSPPGMSRLHEDRPFLFSTDDRDRLAIPALSKGVPHSEPRLRLNTTGGISNASSMRAFTSSVSPPPPPAEVSGSAFVPIGKTGDQFLPQSPPPLGLDRSKFGTGDRTISTGSTSSAHGDLPSSMAEAVLESITSTTAPRAPIGGHVIGASPFRPTEQDKVGRSPFRPSGNGENASSAFRLDNLLQENSGSNVSLFSDKSRNIFAPENAGDRTLLGTHSWGGADDDSHANMGGLGHDFSNLLNLSGGSGAPAMRGRAATEPSWFGGNDPLFVSRIDPEHNADAKGPSRVSSLIDTNSHAPANFNNHGPLGGGKSEDR